MKNVSSSVSPMNSLLRRVLAGSTAMLVGSFAIETQAANPNLIKNGGFETGDFAGWTTIPSPGAQTFYGVSNANNTKVIVVPPGVGIPVPLTRVHSGNYAAFFGGFGPQLDTISQNVPTISRPLLKGVYNVSFWLAPNPHFIGNIPSAFQAVWNGRPIYGTGNTPSGGYQQLTFNVQTTGKSTTLAFQALDPIDFYYLDDVSVTLTNLVQGSFGQFARSANLTPNQRAVASGLDGTGFKPATSPLLQYLDYRELNQLAGDFDRISPEALSSIFTISTSLATVQNTNVQRRTDDLRSGSSGFSAAGLAMNGSGPGFSGPLQFRTGAAGPTGNGVRDGKESKEMKEVAPTENRWGTFITGVGEWVNVGDDSNARGYDISTGGFTLGLDYKVSPNFAVGVMAGYVGTGVDLNNGGKLGLYATAFSGGWYADTAVTGGLNGYDTKRAALQGTARGSTDGGELNMFFGTGYDWKIGGLQIGPTATFNYTMVEMNGFTESGSLAPLNISGSTAQSIRSALGFKASYDWKVGGLLIKPELRAAWQHEYGESSHAIGATFVNGASNGFLVNGPVIGRDSLLLGAGFAIQCSERCATYLYYDGELARTRFDRNAVSGGVRIAF